MTPEDKKRKKDDERRELAAMMLVDAVFDTDERVAEKYGFKDAKTLRNYRQLAASDPVLKGMIEARLAERRKAWAAVLPGAIMRAVRTLNTINQNIENDPNFKSNPGALKEVTTSLEVLAKVELTNKAIDARLAQRHRPDGRQPVGEGAEDGSGSGDEDRPN